MNSDRNGRQCGLRAHQLHLVPSDQERKLSPEIRAKRDELELAIARLRDTKSQIKEDDYYERLEKLVVELGRSDHLAITPDGRVVLTSPDCGDTVLDRAHVHGAQQQANPQGGGFGFSLTATVTADPCNRFGGRGFVTWIRVL